MELTLAKMGGTGVIDAVTKMVGVQSGKNGWSSMWQKWVELSMTKWKQDSDFWVFGTPYFVWYWHTGAATLEEKVAERLPFPAWNPGKKYGMSI